MNRAPRDAVAALDCGTNSTRLLITAPGAPRAPSDAHHPPRPGRRRQPTKLDPDAIAEDPRCPGRSTALRWTAITSAGPGSWPPRRWRDADNGDEFLRAASRR